MHLLHVVQLLVVLLLVLLFALVMFVVELEQMTVDTSVELVQVAADTGIVLAQAGLDILCWIMLKRILFWHSLLIDQPVIQQGRVYKWLLWC